MEVIKGLEKLVPLPNRSIVAIGNFDGIHLGHQKILHFLTTKAKKKHLHSVILTFSPHPEKVFGEKRIRMIQTLDQRIREIEKFGIQTVLVVIFNEEFSSLSAQDFIKKIVIDLLMAKIIIVGEDFHFGKDREGDISLLQRMASNFNFQVNSIPSVRKNGLIVSSSLVRNLLSIGEIEKANDLLGRYYEIEGKVIKGKSRGKSIGFPTANIRTKNEIIPKGIFITTTSIGPESLPSMTNVGKRPTFGPQATNIESFILNFKRNLYGKQIRINFIKKIREEIKFSSPEDLSHQLQKDLEKTKAYFRMK